MRAAPGLVLMAAVLTLPLMRFAGFPVGATWLIPADMALAGLILLVLLSPEARRRATRSKLLVPVGAYLALWGAVALAGRASWLEWVQVLYLAMVGLAASAVARHPGEARLAVRAWTGTAALLAAAAVTVVALWYAGASELVAPFLSAPGSLPPGPYPRVSLLFFGANQLASYLLVGALLAYGSARTENRTGLLALAGLIAAGLATTLSLALGALVTALLLAEGLRRRRAPLLAVAALSFAAVVLVAAVSLPALARGRIEPSVRWRTWGEAVASVRAAPLLGETRGEEMEVRFVAPDGTVQRLVDAHNTFLNVARDAGMPAALLLVWALMRALGPTTARLSGPALAILAAWFLHGQFGSFESTRHLWVLLGIAEGTSAVPGDHGVAEPRGDRLHPVQRLGRERDE